MMMMHFLTTVALVFFSFSSFAKPHSITPDDLSKESLMIELTGKDIKKLKEDDLYAEIVTAYRNLNEISLRTKSYMFLKRFPRSHFADNVLYLGGVMALHNKNYPEALKHFNRIAKEYPHSNKMVAAKFSKAMAYKQLKLQNEAKKVFKEVIAKYPGSPESFRAETELKLLK